MPAERRSRFTKYIASYIASYIRSSISEAEIKPVEWVGSSYKDFIAFPDEVQDHVSYALYIAQAGGKHQDAKPLKGFGGAGVLEVVSDHVGDTFRTVYTVRLETAIYVLHAFQKKSKSGRSTPGAALELVARRLKTAEADDLAKRTKETSR